MKSWSSLGRSASKKEKKDKFPSRPKSMIMNMPSASSSTELVTSIQASPSISTYTNKEKSSPESSKSRKGDGSPVSAKRYLSSAQLKDQARREDLGPVTYAASQLPSLRTPLTAREKVQEQGQANGHHRKRSIPSLIKSPFRASPTPPTADLSPTAAVARGVASSEHSQSQQNASHLSHLESSTSLMSDSNSMGSIQVPPSPSRLPLIDSSPPRTRLTSITSDIPIRKESIRTSKSSKEKQKASRDLSLEELKEDQASAVASLRRLKESDNSSLAEARHLEHLDCMSIVESSQSSLEEIKEQGKPEPIPEPADNNPATTVPVHFVPVQDETSKELQFDKGVNDEATSLEASLKDERINNGSKETEKAKVEAIVDELTKKVTIKENEDSLQKKVSSIEEGNPHINEKAKAYPYALRKSTNKKTIAMFNTPASKKEQQGQHRRRIEAKMQFAIVTQRHNQIASRYIITTPIPALLSVDHLASWTVERFSRITACIIQIFGS